MSENFSEAVAKALQFGFDLAQKKKHTLVTPEHVLLGFLEDPQGYFASIASSLGIDTHILKKEIEQKLSRVATF